MALEVKYHWAAEAELLNEISYLESQATGLGKRLFNEVLLAEKRIQELGETEVPSRTVGEEVMRALQELDPVAYVRFASVYREFKDIDQFRDTIRALTHDKGRS